MLSIISILSIFEVDYSQHLNWKYIFNNDSLKLRGYITELYFKLEVGLTNNSYDNFNPKILLKSLFINYIWFCFIDKLLNFKFLDIFNIDNESFTLTHIIKININILKLLFSILMFSIHTIEDTEFVKKKHNHNNNFYDKTKNPIISNILQLLRKQFFDMFCEFVFNNRKEIAINNIDNVSKEDIKNKFTAYFTDKWEEGSSLKIETIDWIGSSSGEFKIFISFLDKCYKIIKHNTILNPLYIEFDDIGIFDDDDLVMNNKYINNIRNTYKRVINSGIDFVIKQYIELNNIKNINQKININDYQKYYLQVNTISEYLKIPVLVFVSPSYFIIDIPIIKDLIPKEESIL